VRVRDGWLSCDVICDLICERRGAVRKLLAKRRAVLIDIRSFLPFSTGSLGHTSIVQVQVQVPVGDSPSCLLLTQITDIKRDPIRKVYTPVYGVRGQESNTYPIRYVSSFLGA
jgi:hypothetical protein